MIFLVSLSSRCAHVLLYADDSCLVCHRQDINETEKQLNLGFSNTCDWIADSKVSILLSEDKAKSILFASKSKKKKYTKKLNVKDWDMQIKQHSEVKHLGYLMDETISEEAMTLNVIYKINNKLKFFSRRNDF